MNNAEYLAMGGVNMTTEQHLELVCKLLKNPEIAKQFPNAEALFQTSVAVPVPVPALVQSATSNNKRKLHNSGEVLVSSAFPTSAFTPTSAAIRGGTPPPSSPLPITTPPLSPKPSEGLLSPPDSPKRESPSPVPIVQQQLLPNNNYSSTLQQLVLLQNWVPILDKLSPVNKTAIWDICTVMPTFKNYNKASFRKTVTSWATNILPNMASVTILFGAIGYLKHNDVLKNEFCFPNTNQPVFRTFINNPFPIATHNTVVKKQQPLVPPAVKPVTPAVEPALKRPRIMELSSIINA